MKDGLAADIELIRNEVRSTQRRITELEVELQRLHDRQAEHDKRLEEMANSLEGVAQP